MRALRELYDFITGGSLVTPVGVAIAIGVTLAVPSARPLLFVAIVALTFAASTFERPR